MSKLKSIIRKVATSVVLCVSSVILTYSGYMTVGMLLGAVLHPHEHKHYECACDEPPILTETESTVVGIVLMAVMMALLWGIVRKQNFPLWAQIVLFAILLYLNINVALFVRELLYIQVTG